MCFVFIIIVIIIIKVTTKVAAKVAVVRTVKHGKETRWVYFRLPVEGLFPSQGFTH